MTRRLLLLAAAAAACAAQDTQPPNASISGVVKDSVNGRPLANYNVSTFVIANGTPLASGNTRQPSSITDEQGRYKLSDLPAGNYSITARSSLSFTSSTTRHITLAGHDLDNVDFTVIVDGTVTGRVLDENREPMPGMVVRLVSREYYNGVLGYFITGTANTDDRGIYVLQRVQAGRPFLLMAEQQVDRRMPARSEAPLEPRLRRRVPMRTYYPNSPDKEGGSPVTVRPGERREGVDIEVRKSASFCIEGSTSSLGGTAALPFEIEAAQPAFGQSSSGGMYSVMPGSRTGPDGHFRVCGLAPGQYRLTASNGQQNNVTRGLTPFEIADRDLRNVDVNISPGLTIQGEVVWDGPAPETPVTAKVGVNLAPLLRTMVANERPGARSDLPGTFSLEGLLLTDYAHRETVNSPGVYIKDVTYGGKSILYEPLRAGAMTADLGVRVVVGRDGGTISARVVDKDGNPQSDLNVICLPAAIASEAMLQMALVTGQTDQQGQYQSHPLRPGKYLLYATTDRINATPEFIDNLWRSRNRFQDVDVAPNGAAQVTITLK
jgi:hypothetical protein